MGQALNNDESDFESAELFSILSEEGTGDEGKKIDGDWVFDLKQLRKFRKYNFETFIHGFESYFLVRESFKNILV